MRTTAYLRTPIRADHQDRMTMLTLGEDPFAGNPLPKGPWPQSLVLTFTPASGVSEIQIAPCWEGYLTFLADDKTGYPTQPSAVTKANAVQWPLKGDLVLDVRDLGGMAKTLTTHAPSIDPVPSVVRYSKVKLTIDFLFITLASVKAYIYVDGKTPPLQFGAPNYAAQLVIQFLQGRAAVPCLLDSKDAKNDFAAKPMPSVALAPGQQTIEFRVAMSHRAVVPAGWFAARQEDPVIAGLPLINPALNNDVDGRFNPVHPAHSIVPPRCLFQRIVPEAAVAEHAAAPLWTLLRSDLGANRAYRCVEVARPPIYGDQVTYFPTRPYPLYQLVWQSLDDGTIQSTRLPLNGKLYLPLADGSYFLWAATRNDRTILPETIFGLSTRDSNKRYIPLAQSGITVPFVANQTSQAIYAHLLTYDSARTWQAWVDLGAGYVAKMNAARARWHLPVYRWSIYVADTTDSRAKTGAMRDFAEIHGLIRASAGRHGLAPEFLHAIFFGEGVGGPNGPIEKNWQPGPPAPYNPNYSLVTGYELLGLDRIWAEKRELIANGYLDQVRFENSLENHLDGNTMSVILPDGTKKDPPVTNEDGHTVIDSGDPKGWEAGIELVAATLDARLDMMLQFANRQRDKVPELERRFLAYFGFHSYTDANRRRAAGESAKWIRDKWNNAPEPKDPGDRKSVV